jgi:hypothetical protein
MEKTSGKKIDDSEAVRADDSRARTEGLVYAALRVWELKRGFSD